MVATQIAGRDYIMVLDASGSMTETDCPGGKSRWEYMKETTKAIVRHIIGIDPDGISIYRFASSFNKYENINSADAVDPIFAANPIGSTVLAPVLNDIFKDFFAKRDKPLTVLIVTDGEPNDPDEVARSIVAATQKMEADEELCLSFLQIGKASGAKAYLSKLDDDLQKIGAKFDIVDTKTFDEVEKIGLEQLLLDAIND